MNIFIMAMSVGLLSAPLCSAQAANNAERGAAWFAGVPVELQVATAAKKAPSASRPDVIVYVTAQTLATTPERAAGALPPHDHVLTHLPPAKKPADGFAYLVVSGPKADDTTVRVQPQLDASASALVKEIFVGTDWVELNNHAVIEYGLAMQWLALQPHGYVGQVAARYLDEVNLNVEVEITPPVALPAQGD